MYFATEEAVAMDARPTPSCSSSSSRRGSSARLSRYRSLFLLASAQTLKEVSLVAATTTATTTTTEHPRYQIINEDLRVFRELKETTMAWIDATNATFVPFQRGAWLYGDYRTEVPNMREMEDCRQGCAGDTDCYHWVWRVTDSRCDYHKMEGELSDDVSDSIVGHEGHRRNLAGRSSIPPRPQAVEKTLEERTGGAVSGGDEDAAAPEEGKDYL